MTENLPGHWNAKDKFEYYQNKVESLLATRHEPFDDDYTIEMYMEDLDTYMKYQKIYYEEMQKDVKVTLDLTPCMFVTYNPKPDVTLKTALKAVESFVTKTKISNYIYVVEQRGTEEQNMGAFHIHIIHTHTYDRVSHYLRETRSTFNKTCNVNHFSCLNFKPCKRDQDITNRLEYILGQKKDEDGLNKTQKQLIDKAYRKKYMLKDYYTDNFAHWEQYR